VFGAGDNGDTGRGETGEWEYPEFGESGGVMAAERVE